MLLCIISFPLEGYIGVLFWSWCPFVPQKRETQKRCFPVLQKMSTIGFPRSAWSLIFPPTMPWYLTGEMVAGVEVVAFLFVKGPHQQDKGERRRGVTCFFAFPQRTAWSSEDRSLV